MGIAHINHGLRPESDFEEQSLRKMASDLEIPIFVDRFTGEFTEQKAREFRYHFFEKIMIAENYDVLLTAHHQGDVVETVLMRQITGRPLRSLQGIADCQTFAKGQLIRPLLKFTKEELDAAVFYEDSTNQGVDYFRNRIRISLFLNYKENPQFSQAISDLSSEIKMALTVINQRISELEIIDEKISYHKFISQTKELQHFILQAFFAQYPEIKVSKKKFEEILHIIRRPQQYSAQLNKDFQFVKTKDHFYIEKRKLITASLEILSENPNDTGFMEVYLPLEGQLEIRKRQPGIKFINGTIKNTKVF
ncbi:tRNA lysidine(34) synthetase TilS [Lactococcus cremoris]